MLDNTGDPTIVHDDLVTLELSSPRRAFATDDPIEILDFAAASFKGRGTVALATLTDIRGGAAKGRGAHMAICDDGRYCGYVSGGCVETSVAAETLLAMAEGRDRTLALGEGSKYFDIVLPCGGGITVAIHLLGEVQGIRWLLSELAQRRPAALAYTPEMQSLRPGAPPMRSGWEGDTFVTLYRPLTRIVISGQTLEAQTTAAAARALGYDVLLRDMGTRPADIAAMIDPYTAVAFLHHDLDQEAEMLEAVLSSNAFYIGALGSTRTHRKRQLRLEERGFQAAEIARIKAPIGMVGPTRDSRSLALSVLADIAAARLAAYGSDR